jgi:hypothetical protein
MREDLEQNLVEGRARLMRAICRIEPERDPPQLSDLAHALECATDRRLHGELVHLTERASRAAGAV